MLVDTYMYVLPVMKVHNFYKDVSETSPPIHKSFKMSY